MYKTPRENKRELLNSLTVLLGAFFILLVLGSIVFHIFEDWSYLESLYYATISLTARGFSNNVPQHWFSIVFSVFYLIIGVAILLATISNLVAFYTMHYQDNLEKKIDIFKENFKKKKKKPNKWISLNIKK